VVLVDALLSLGAPLQLVDRNGMTAMQAAKHYRLVEVIPRLRQTAGSSFP